MKCISLVVLARGYPLPVATASERRYIHESSLCYVISLEFLVLMGFDGAKYERGPLRVEKGTVISFFQISCVRR